MSTTKTGGGARPLGGAAKWRLAESLTAMEAALSARGARLDIVKGGAEEAILTLAAATDASRVLWSRRYEGEAIALDARVKAALKERGVEATSFNGRLMREPWELSKPGGEPVRVFTAFWRRHRALGPLPAPTPAPKRLTAAPWPHEAPQRVSIESLKLRPTKPDWSGELSLGESPGEAGALAALETFAAGALRLYADQRDILAPGAASRLSAHLRFGEISPRRVAHAVETAAAAQPALADAAEKYMAELGWRDFAPAQLYAHPDLATRGLRGGVRALPLAQRRGGFSRLDAREDRLSDRRRRHAAVMADRVFAQSRAPDRCFVPRQAPAHRLATRRGMVLGHADRRRSGQQSAQLAMGRGRGRRFRALLPHLQSRAAG